MSRNRREHGRIISVETKTRGDALADDVAAGVTSITVNDAGDFDEDGGWLLIGGQVVEFTECDDDTGIITLAAPLAAAAEQGDPVQVWSELYEETIDYQQALVELDGEYDNPDPVVAEVAEGVGELPDGDRGRGGESCTLHRVSEDEWEVVGVGGRGRQSQGIRWEQDDFYALTAEDIAAGSATMPLSHRPNDEALTCVLAGAPQRPTNWTIDYDAQTLTQTLSGWEAAGDVLWSHYAYRKGLAASVRPTPSPWFHWTLDETSGTTWADSGPYAVDMAVYNATLGQPSASGPGYSATFNGTNAYGSAGATVTTLTDVMGGQAAASWGFWVKTTQTTAATILARDAANHTPDLDDRYWTFGLSAGKLNAGIFADGGASTSIESPATINDGAWHRCWVALGGGTLTMFIDGAQVAETAWASPIRSGGLKGITLGGGSYYGEANYNWFAGSLDDVMIVGSKVTLADVQGGL